MGDFTESDYESYQQDLQLLVDTLRQCFGANKARYHVAGHQNLLYIEIEGLEQLDETEIMEVAEPVLDELDLDFDEILLVPLH